MTRWRTLHELTVSAQFLKKHGEEAARLYLEHAALVTSKRAKDYRNYEERLSLEPINEDELLDHDSKFQRLLDRYGRAFTTDYGWAAVVLGTKRAEFSSIEKDVELDHWRPYYRMASDSVHAGFRGSQYDLGFGQFPPEVMLAGPSNAGLVEPAQCMILDLNLCTITFLSYRVTPRAAMRIHLLNKLALDARDKFVEADRELQQNERLIRSVGLDEDA